MRYSEVAKTKPSRRYAQLVYRFPDAQKGAIDVNPISGRKFISTANCAGLAPSAVPVLLIESDNWHGLGYGLTKGIGDAGIDVSFVMAQVVGRRYAAVFGFKSDDDAAKAATLIKEAATQTRARCRERLEPRCKALRGMMLGCAPLCGDSHALVWSLIDERSDGVHCLMTRWQVLLLLRKS